MSAAMRARPSLLALALASLAVVGSLAPPVQAQTPKTRPAGPKAIGTFEQWTAAIHKEAGQTVCYAFTYAQSSSTAISGRGQVVLTVTERPAGGRDAVAISAGFTYAPNADVKAVVDVQPSLDFYTSHRSAFARDGHAAVQSFLKGGKLVATSPAPKGDTVADTFSLKGFNAAYAAIVKACPPGKAGT
jgi:invasion protein IalB